MCGPDPLGLLTQNLSGLGEGQALTPESQCGLMGRGVGLPGLLKEKSRVFRGGFLEERTAAGAERMSRSLAAGSSLALCPDPHPRGLPTLSVLLRVPVGRPACAPRPTFRCGGPSRAASFCRTGRLTTGRLHPAGWWRTG